MAGDAQLLKGILEGCILALLQREKNYGYKVVEGLRNNGFDDIHEVTVYPILTRLHNKGILESEKRPSDIGPPRKYYGLTPKGDDSLQEFLISWGSTKQKVDRIIEELRT
ncbi:MAG: PadR family transcriptional regulator [Pseudomonadales bacterium]|jgi:PadR family transcriptional regulator PadR|nr:PadR family transcriptional regulator [Pseudomonadales bacterium]MDP7597176.1 PadR family transcriptional regulator [Pseudomonadales bacterium]HJN49009.1 PadR family transcriptional regulator [Pseudomonadales bacterium]|tara:strand:- start:368 stop:697 length:330 start_codon:yes stop_codon:yes gene_type:complete